MSRESDVRSESGSPILWLFHPICTVARFSGAARFAHRVRVLHDQSTQGADLHIAKAALDAANSLVLLHHAANVRKSRGCHHMLHSVQVSALYVEPNLEIVSINDFLRLKRTTLRILRVKRECDFLECIAIKLQVGRCIT